MPPEHLSRLQERFWKLVALPGGVAGRLPEVAKDDPEIAPLSRWIAASNDAQAANRLGRYAGMYFARLLEILQDDYPKLHALVGTTHFQNLARDYLTAHPSEDPSVRHVGGRLPEFLRDHPLNEDLPYLCDLAALEWARVDVFDRAEPARLLLAEDIQGVAPEQWAGLRFEAISSLELVAMDYPAEKVWLALEKDEELPAVAADSTHVLVWREGFSVLHRRVSAEEARALEALVAGKPFAQICEAFAGTTGALEEAATSAAQALARWVTEKLLVRVLPPE